jgi:hypothetical protein
MDTMVEIDELFINVGLLSKLTTNPSNVIYEVIRRPKYDLKCIELMEYSGIDLII